MDAVRKGGAVVIYDYEGNAIKRYKLTRRSLIQSFDWRTLRLLGPWLVCETSRPSLPNTVTVAAANEAQAQQGNNSASAPPFVGDSPTIESR